MYQTADIEVIGYGMSDCRDEGMASTQAESGATLIMKFPTSAQIRHESEVRTISQWSKERIRGFLEFVEQKRSPECYQRLRTDLIKVVGAL